MSFYFVLAIANNRLLSVTDTEVRIRHYGLLANRAKGVKLAAARAALDYQPLSTLAKAESVGISYAVLRRKTTGETVAFSVTI